MWTPKRILLLAGGFLVFTLIYIVYSLTSLGRINTLPPLPDRYQPQADPGKVIARPHPRSQPSSMEHKLEEAFHKGCEEAKWPFQFEVNSKSMVLAAEDFHIENDGRVMLARMSLAIFGKDKHDGREREINTLRCSQAYIRFDRPVSSFSFGEMNGRKIVEAELHGNAKTPIFLTNNRRTAAREDDLLVRITEGPVYYIEQTHLIRTSDHIHLEDGEKHLVDGRLVPPKAVIDARGMEMELTTATPPPRPGIYPAAKPKNENISGVKRIVLKENVVMNLYAARGGPFPGNKAAANNAPPPGQKPGAAAPHDAPAHIRIATPGTFRYELLQDHDMAYFDVPADVDLTGSPQDVTVQRLNEQAGNDMLVCKHLELRLKRRSSETPAGGPAAARPAAPRDAGSSEQGVEIETAHATGPYVTLISDAEKLDAHGTDFFHEVGKKLTILKGSPLMEATKEDSVIRAPELRIQEIPLPADSVSPPGINDKKTSAPAKTYQQVQATGPGSIQMNNKTTGKPTMHARWNKSLLSTRDTALNMDQLVLLGEAEFQQVVVSRDADNKEVEHDQSLKAEELKVWLLTEEKKATAAQDQPQAAGQAAAPQGQPQPAAPQGQAQTAGKAAAPSQSRRPHRVVALRNVRAHSMDLNIHDAGRLVINFTDVPLSRLPPPPANKGKPGAASPDNKAAAAPENKAVVAPSSAPPSVAAPAAGARPAAPGASVLSQGGNRQPAAAKQTQTEEKQPIDLSASNIEADVLRCGERMALDRLWAAGGSLESIDKRGGVIVQQKPSKPGEEGVYIEGNTLNMNCTANGNKLEVTGDLAHLKMDKIFILGSIVNIDQVENKAWVDGEGAMRMQSDKTLDGKALEHPEPLTIHWNRHMVFFGTHAIFEGGIQAEQKEAHLACQVLQVYFDRPISLKEGTRGDRPAKVSSLVADKSDSDQPIRVEDQVYEGDQLQKYQLLMGNNIQMTTIPRDEDIPNSSGKTGDANKVILYGPGSVRIVQRGDADLTLSPGKPAPNRNGGGANTALYPGSPPVKEEKPAQHQQMKLTYITFEKSMQASTLTNVASFWEAVRVLNMPLKDQDGKDRDPHCDIDLDDMLSRELPTGAMYLRCNQLKVGTTQEEYRDAQNKKQVRTYQNMDAVGQVYVQGREFSAQCDHMTFNEKKDQVIFIGEGDNYAVLSKRVAKGHPPQVIRARKIIYYRSTGKVDGSVFNSFDG